MLPACVCHRRFQRINAWLLVLALLFQSGLAMACAGHDLLHAWGVDSHHSDQEHAIAQGQGDHSGASEAGHDLFHGGHGSLHAPVLLNDASWVVMALAPAPPLPLQASQPPSPRLDLNLRPPITG